MKFLKFLADAPKCCYAVVGILTALILSSVCGTAHSENIHYVRMQFTDWNDLGAKTQAFIAVEDTIGGYFEPQDSIWTERFGWCKLVDSTGERTYYPRIITCRELIVVTVTEEPTRLHYYRDNLEFDNWGLRINDEWWEYQEVGLSHSSHKGEYSFDEVIPGTALILFREVE